MSVHSRSLQTPAEFYKTTIPELVGRWSAHCFCTSPGFNKLVSFDFRDYSLSPMSLVDADLVIGSIILQKFEALGEWSSLPGGGSERIHRCPQCGETYTTQNDQFSINMDCITSRPTRSLPKADIGEYAVGFHCFASGLRELERVSDFRSAASVEEFVVFVSAPS